MMYDVGMYLGSEAVDSSLRRLTPKTNPPVSEAVAVLTNSSSLDRVQTHLVPVLVDHPDTRARAGRGEAKRVALFLAWLQYLILV